MSRVRALTGLLACAIISAAPAQAGGPDAARQRELLHLIQHDCGSCHGMRLTGGLGPALTVAAVRDKPLTTLAASILHGRPGTAMPAWNALLSDADAQWIAAQLKQGISSAR